MKTIILTVSFAISLCPVWAQITQSHPEYCGIPGGVNPPSPNVSATLNRSAGHATLYIGQGSAVELPGLISEISEVCPLSDGRLVVFGEIPRYEGIAENIFVVDTTKNSLVDSFWVYHSVLSPDQRWIAYTKFAPFYVEASTEIMLYDLSKTPAQNRPKDDDSWNKIDPEIDVGTPIFPPGHENFALSNIFRSGDHQIVHTVGTLYWSPDSRAIVFKDVVANDPGIALVTLDQNGAASVFRHALTEADICGSGPGGGLGAATKSVSAAVGSANRMWQLDRADFGPSGAIVLDVSSSSGAGCGPHVLQLRQDDFQPATPELHVKPPKYIPGPDDGPGKTRRRDKQDK